MELAAEVGLLVYIASVIFFLSTINPATETFTKPLSLSLLSHRYFVQNSCYLNFYFRKAEVHHLCVAVGVSEP